jgi:predicted DsbA family dithiol-disulfide isomerase
MAIAQFDHSDEVKVRWRSFRLVPDAAPSRPESGEELAAERYEISTEKARSLQDHITGAAAKDGLDLHFEKYILANSTDAHRVAQMAFEYGRQDQFEEVCMRGFLSDGELMSDHGTLMRLALEVGLPVDEVRDVLASDRFLAQVEEDEKIAKELGVNQVPFFLINNTGRYSPDVLGGMKQGQEGPPVEVFLEMLGQEWDNAALHSAR